MDRVWPTCSRPDAVSATQEQAWILLAATTAPGQAPATVLDVDGTAQEPRKTALYLPADADDAGQGHQGHQRAATDTVYGRGDGDRRAARGPAAGVEGFTIKRTIYTLDGEEADLTKVKQNDLMVVVLTGKVGGRVYHQALMIDLLPAGFEVENARLAEHAADRTICPGCPS